MKKLQYSLPVLFIVIGLASLFMLLRHYFVFSESPAHNPIGRAHLLPPLFACLAVFGFLSRRPEQIIKGSAFIGMAASSLVAATLTIEIAESLRRIRYWDWVADLPLFLLIVGGHTVFGGVLGLAIAYLFKALPIGTSA